jgi:hypothetical protein
MDIFIIFGKFSCTKIRKTMHIISRLHTVWRAEALKKDSSSGSKNGGQVSFALQSEKTASPEFFSVADRSALRRLLPRRQTIFPPLFSLKEIKTGVDEAKISFFSFDDVGGAACWLSVGEVE